MAFSRTFLLLSLAFAVVLLMISSEVSVRQLAEATQTQSAETNMEETRYGNDPFGLRHRHGHRHRHRHGKGHRKGGHGGLPGNGADEDETEDGEN